MKQLSQRQRRRNLIKSLLQFKDAQETETQKLPMKASQKYIENATLEAQIKQFDCQQIQNQPHIELYQSIICKYNPYRKAQFLCCSKYCDNHAIICGEQNCKCLLEHHKCTFTLIEYFLHQITSKLQQPTPKDIDLYFQVKSVIYQHMAYRISQERQALMDWQKDMHNESTLFLYGFNLDQSKACYAPKITCQKIHSNHQKCCIPLQITKKQIREGKEQIMKVICKKIHKKYSSMIEYFDQKADQLQYHKKFANLNLAQFIFIDFLKNKNNFIEHSEHRQVNLDEGLKLIKIVPGRVIFLALKYNKHQFKNLDQGNFCINTIRRIWKGYSEKIFRLFVEGKAMNELFLQMGKLGLLKIYLFQDIRSLIDKIIQSISQPQKQLFSKSILTKKLLLTNLYEEQICTNFKKYKGKESKEIKIGDNRQSPLRNIDVKFDQVCISNDRLYTAFNDIETIKQLGNLGNITKLEIKWCQQMKAQVSMEILNTMPHLKQLALLNHLQKLCQNFMKKLCQFKQLTLFYTNSSSHPQFYRSYNEDVWFIPLNSLKKANVTSIKQLLELSKLPKLQNIEISFVNDPNSTQVIKNIKSLRHLTLGYNWGKNDEADFGLMKQLCEQRTLTTLSLIGLKLKSKQVDLIITNNILLKTIIIRNHGNNENINDRTVACMANLIQLQNLCIQSNTVITGKHLNKLNKLIMLEIQHCRNVSKKQMKEAITKMHKLQHFDMKSNKWFDDEVITSVQTCKQLRYLNIRGTSVSCEGLKHLEGLKNLNILICGCYTKINGKNLIQLTKQTARITRISIKSLNLNDNELQQISANCEGLTHLDIRDANKITAEALLKIKDLKVVYSELDEDSSKKLREAGIKTY